MLGLHTSQEGLGALVLRVVDDLLGVTLLDDDPAVHEDHSVGDIAREGHLVGDDDHRHPLLGQLPHDGQDLADQLGVERRRRLVEEHQLRSHRQSPRNRDPLLLPTRELPGVCQRLVREPHALEQLLGPDGHLGLLLPLDLHRGLDDVVEDGLVREEIEALEDHADLAALAGDLLVVQAMQHPALVGIPHELAIDPDPAAVDGLQLVDATQEGRLARAGGAEEADDFTLVDVHVDALEHLVVAE